MTRQELKIRMPIAVAAILALSACAMESPTLQETRELELAVSPDGHFYIEAGAGSLSVQGDADTSVIQVEAEIFQVHPNDNYTLMLETDSDGAARLVSETDSGWNNDHIDLTVRVPDSLRLNVTDGSGSLKVRGLNNHLDINDGSGSIRIADIDGNVTIDDGSGSIRTERISGGLDIVDGSGSITVMTTGGDVTIDDGSGSITVRETGGVVTVSDRSGSITVDGAQDFRLLEDGSGSVNLNNIRSRTRSGD